MACGIYGIHNTINDKWYVGQSVDIKARWSVHKSLLNNNTGESIHFLIEWNKYGPDAFEWIIIEECSPDKLDDREIFWITKKNSYNNGYNRTLGGGGMHVHRLSKSHREILSRDTLKIRKKKAGKRLSLVMRN